jgi:hypothetical protein
MKFITFISACLIGVSVWAQDCHYDEISKGTIWLMTNFDKNGKLESSSALAI